MLKRKTTALDNDDSSMESSYPCTAEHSPRARELGDIGRTREIRGRLSGLHLHNEPSARPPSAAKASHKFDELDFMSDDMFETHSSEHLIDMAKLEHLARKARAQRAVSLRKKRRANEAIEIPDSPSNSDSDEHVLPEEQALDDTVSKEDLELIEQLPTNRQPSTSSTRPSTSGTVEINFIKFKGENLRAGDCCELLNGDFLRITRVLLADGDLIRLSGWLLRRCSPMHGLLPRKINELCLLSSLSNYEFQAGIRKKEVLIDLRQVKRLRDLTFTNKPLKECNISTVTERGGFRSYAQARAEGPLFCRWKYLTVDSGLTGRTKYSHPRILSLMNRDEADKGFEADPAYLRDIWRQRNTKRGGSETETRPRRSGTTVGDAINLEAQNQGDESRDLYSYGDAFSGGGGVSAGVSQVPGIKIKWAFDQDGYAFRTYGVNFHDVTIYQSPAHLFIYEDADDLFVDILHGSPPCQTWSPAHTSVGKNDEANADSLFTMHELISRCKPRVVCLEETSGLIERHREYFNALIHVFTNLGYSVQWKVMNFLQYGVPQPRRRLIIIATGPGEKEAPFPAPTHGPTLLPFRTIGDCISNIPENATHHEPMVVPPEGSNWPKAPYDPNTFARTITCAPDCYHPTGRPFTIRELALLQTFPMDFKFSKHGAKRQIGNAVPPLVAKLIFREIEKSLRETDESET